MPPAEAHPGVALSSRGNRQTVGLLVADAGRCVERGIADVALHRVIDAGGVAQRYVAGADAVGVELSNLCTTCIGIRQSRAAVDGHHQGRSSAGYADAGGGIDSHVADVVLDRIADSGGGGAGIRRIRRAQTDGYVVDQLFVAGNSRGRSLAAFVITTRVPFVGRSTATLVDSHRHIVGLLVEKAGGVVDYPRCRRYPSRCC